MAKTSAKKSGAKKSTAKSSSAKKSSVKKSSGKKSVAQESSAKKPASSGAIKKAARGAKETATAMHRVSAVAQQVGALVEAGAQMLDSATGRKKPTADRARSAPATAKAKAAKKS